MFPFTGDYIHKMGLRGQLCMSRMQDKFVSSKNSPSHGYFGSYLRSSKYGARAK